MSSAEYTVGLETSGRIGSIALLRGNDLLAERTLGESGRRHARTLILELDEMLAQEELAPRDIATVAVSIGPGSFTGLRVGIVCAKTWAYATGCRLAAVDTFHVLAAQWPQPDRPLWIIDDALRGDVFAQRFEPDPVGTVRLLPFKQWLEETSAGEGVSGPGASLWTSELTERGLIVAPIDRQRPTAAAVASLGAGLAHSGQLTDPFTLVPLYIRRSAAEEKLDSLATTGPTS